MREWNGLLQHTDARQRKTAIAALAKSKDLTSVGTLEQVSLHDPDEHVRQYAAQAIRYIKKQTTLDYAVNAEPDFLRNVSFHDVPVSAILRTQQSERAPNWWITDLTVHTLVNVLGCLLVAILILPRFASAFQTQVVNFPGYGSDMLARLSALLLNAHFDELVVVGLLLGIFSVFVSFLTFRLMHHVATHLFGGANTFPGMLHDTLMPYTIISAMLYALYFIMSLVNPLVILGTGDNSFSFGVILAVLVLYGTAYWVLGHILGKAYSFGTQKGCLTVATAIFLCGFGGFLMGTLFGSH